MPKTLLNFLIEEDLLARLDEWRFENRFPSRAAALIWMIQTILERKITPKKPTTAKGE